MNFQRTVLILLHFIRLSQLALADDRGSVRYYVYTGQSNYVKLTKVDNNRLELIFFVTNDGYFQPEFTGRQNTPPDKIAVQYREGSEKIWHSNHEPSWKPNNVNTVTITTDGKKETSYRIRIVGYHAPDIKLNEIEDPNITIYGPYETNSKDPPTQDKVKLKWHQSNENHLYLGWDILDGNYFGRIDHYVLKWNYTKISCNPPKGEFDEKWISVHEYSYELPVKLYSRYSILFCVESDRVTCEDFSTPFQAEYIATEIAKEIGHDEIPVVKKDRITLKYMNLNIYFETIDCEKFQGPLEMYYTATCEPNQNDCRNINSIRFPLKNDHLVIPNLSPYSRYSNIGIYLVPREENRVPRTVYSINSFIPDYGVVTEAIRDLTVTSKGPDHIALRWLPPSPPSDTLNEYFVDIKKGVMNTPKRYTINSERCALWAEYHCHTIVATDEGLYNISIFSLNRYDPSKAKLDKELEIAAKKHLYRDVETNTSESKPEPPYNVKVSWKPAGQLNVCWNHPNSTNGHVKSFSILVRINKDHDTYYDIKIDSPKNYHLEYCKSVTVMNETIEKIDTLHMYVMTQLTSWKSIWRETTMIAPPEPSPYKGVLKLECKRLNVCLPDGDVFFSYFYVFKAVASEDVDVEQDLDKLQFQMRNDQYEPKNTTINEFVYFYIRSKDAPTGKFIVIPGEYNQSEEYKITVFVVNKLNEARKVTRKSMNVKCGHHKEKMETKHHYVTTSIIVVALLVLTFLGCLFYRYRHKLFFPTSRLGNALVIYSNADDVAPLTESAILSNEFGKKEFHFNPQTDLPSSQSFHSKRVKVQELRNYIKSAMESQELHRQHELIPKFNASTALDNKLTCVYGSLPQNKSKNRYNSVVAFDHSRVKLKKIPGDEFSDYINANYINGYQKAKAYIATQGPKTNTVNDFWRMVWENHVNYIVMLTNIYNGDKKVCEQYWPEGNKPLEFEEITIEFVDSAVHPTYDVREFRISCRNHTREISQIHFKLWPLLGEALFPQTLVPLVQKMLTIPYSAKSPILVHCSAGIGRTGTIILCDMCLRMAGAEGAVDILHTLQMLRSQRPNLVDNIEQYKLAHLVILATLTVWNTSIPCDGNCESAIDKILDQTDTVSHVIEYIKECEWQDDAMKTAATAMRKHVPIVPEKNRYPGILPDKLFQVALQELPDRGATSCYINAIRVNSYRYPNRYIVTQHPLPTTLSDFWRLVVENQSSVIVNLNPIDHNDQTSIKFWPQQKARLSLENLEVEHVKTSIDKQISIHKLRTGYWPNGSEEVKLAVDVLNFNEWPTGKITPESVESFMSFVIDCSSIGKRVFPIIVTCHDGVTASGIFIALSNLIEQMQEEKVCDVCQTVRSIRICRKQFVNQGIQIQLLYEAAKSYVSSLQVYQEPGY